MMDGGKKNSSTHDAHIHKIQHTLIERIIIGSENQIKAVFDIFVLLMVLYSCIISVFEVAFVQDTEKSEPQPLTSRRIFDQTLEFLFLFDILLNFIHSY